jgi:prepilin-type N-terminal cleavage/methylation domain-containing protein
MIKISAKGFTLIEIAIALVVIGLLAGGVLQGRELIEQARIRKVISEIKDINLAANTFRLKYSKFPGDFENAELFFGSANICNGNGNGLLGDAITPPCLRQDVEACPDPEAPSFYAHTELSSFWKHLYAAGMYNQTVCGGPDNGGEALKYNYINSNYPGLGYQLVNTTYYGRVSTWLSISGDDNIPILPVDSAYSIDEKLDDGVCNTGNLISFGTIAGPCTCPNSGIYSLGSNEKCPLRHDVAKWFR